jgi:hypothetical protein
MSSRKRDDGCRDRAADDEPLFTLRAQDVLAPGIVRAWADAAKAAGSPASKVDDALQSANEMEAWQAANHSKVPD